MQEVTPKGIQCGGEKMSWFKRSGSTAVGTYHRNNVGALPSASALHIRAAADSAMLLHNVHSLWNTVESVLIKQEVGLTGPSENETVAVLSFITEVASSLECHNTTAHTQVTDFLLMVDAMNKKAISNGYKLIENK